MRLDHRTGEGDALDPQLVLRARDGDPSALAILYECYYDRIHRYVLARVANADMHFADSEVDEMERIVREVAELPASQAALCVQIAIYALL